MAGKEKAGKVKGIEVNFTTPDKYDRIIMQLGGFDAAKQFMVLLRTKDIEIDELQTYIKLLQEG